MSEGDTAIPAPTKRPRGRPKGSTNKKPAAPRAPRAGGRTAAAAPPPIDPTASVPVDDLAAEGMARRVAAAAAPADPSPGAGRPTAAQAEQNKLARHLATSYRGLAGMAHVMGTMLAVSPKFRTIGTRLIDVAGEVERNADECGLALARWADTNPAVKRWLTQGSSASALLMVVAAHAPIIAAGFGRADIAPVVGLVADLASSDASTPPGDVGAVAGGGGPFDFLGGLFGGDGADNPMMSAFAQAFAGAQPAEAPAS